MTTFIIFLSVCIIASCCAMVFRFDRGSLMFPLCGAIIAVSLAIVVSLYAELDLQFKTAKAECEAELPRHLVCETKVIAIQSTVVISLDN